MRVQPERVASGAWSGGSRQRGVDVGKLDGWLSEAVPGGLVKYATISPEGATQVAELIEHGAGAKSELGVL